MQILQILDITPLAINIYYFLQKTYFLIFLNLGRTAFEKMTDLDYVGETYYTIRNLSLYECQGWCREEPECSAASFSFAVNPNSSPPRQETVCLLQNGTQATNPSAKPLRALNQYYMVKMSVRSGNIYLNLISYEMSIANITMT